MDPPDQKHYKEHSSAERINSNLKDNYCGRHVRMRGLKKVACHLMFGLLALTATQLFSQLLVGTAVLPVFTKVPTRTNTAAGSSCPKKSDFWWEYTVPYKKDLINKSLR